MVVSVVVCAGLLVYPLFSPYLVSLIVHYRPTLVILFLYSSVFGTHVVLFMLAVVLDGVFSNVILIDGLLYSSDMCSCQAYQLHP